MNQLFVKLRIRGNSVKYRKLLSTEDQIYPVFDDMVDSAVKYDTRTLIDDGEWFYIEEFSEKDFAIDIISDHYDTVDFDSLNYRDFNKIDYLFTLDEDTIYFQNISKSSLIQRKAIFHVGEGFKYDEGCSAIILNKFPDAIYKKQVDTLYFRKLSTISSIFKGIDQLYREATKQETVAFLDKDFITLKNGFGTERVKIANRKRIAMAVDTLKSLDEREQERVFSYIGEYCPDLKSTDHSFEIGSEDDLKLLLFGIEQRFYTTLVGGQKRIANSVIAMS